jgi:hypothetical protein
VSEHRLAVTPNQAQCFREAFARAGYNEEGLTGTLGQIQLPMRLGRDRGHFRRLTGGGRPLDTMIRLFLLGLPENIGATRCALESPPLTNMATTLGTDFDRLAPNCVALTRQLIERGFLLPE